jgi:hypothetical protein
MVGQSPGSVDVNCVVETFSSRGGELVWIS